MQPENSPLGSKPEELAVGIPAREAPTKSDSDNSVGAPECRAPMPIGEETPQAEPVEMTDGLVDSVDAAPIQTGAAPKKKRSVIWEWVETIVIALILALILRTFVVQPYEVHLSSMVPTLMEGDFILVSKLAYKLGTAQRGDVVVFIPPNGSDRDYVKRVIGLPGETIDIQDGQVKINGTPLVEPYAKGQTTGGRYNHLEIPQGTVFCMGDNRLNSSDSRNFGPVSISAMEGKTILLFWPFLHFKWTL
ncbi:MAG: signal peptidase I [bacterium]